MDAKVVDSLRSAIDGLKSAIDTGNAEAEKKWQEHFDRLEFDVKRMQSTPKVEEGAESETFVKAARLFAKGGISAVEREFKDAKVTSAMSRKADNMVRYDFGSAGALLMPSEMSSDINKQIVEFTPVLQLARVVNTSSHTYRQRKRNTSLSASWLAENVAGDKTKSVYGYTDVPVHKLTARVGWSIEQEQDSDFNLREEVMGDIREQFEVSLGQAFLSGDGINKPTGMIGRVTPYASAPAALTSVALITMQAILKTGYQRNASWMMNRQTMAKVRALTIAGGTNNYIWEPSFQAGTPSRLLGSPVYEAPDLAGTSAANFTQATVPIIYGDFKNGYLVARNRDFYLIEDRFTEADAFATNLNAMTRFGGDVIRAEAIVEYQSA